ncbi:MAG TPA: DHH family phosphoesterase [Candidatus Saccharimonadales bacterium]|nr:DHH family phosphoesterase [Candidatus Saccharimonadales bacterium]
MPPYSEADQIQKILGDAQHVVIMQADNPDGDSVGSALALEQILGDMGKETSLYCGVAIPTYLSYLAGWDRVSKDIPANFDAAIIVDTSTETLFENLEKSGQRSWVAARPVIVLDHHAVESTIPYATVSCNKTAVATGEVIYELSRQLNWPLNLSAQKMVMTAIMSDSLGLTTDATTARTIAIVSELVAGGVKIAELEQARREMMRKSPELIQYKGKLLQRIEYYADNRVATVTIPWPEIEKYSPEYNPSMLVIDDMRMSTDTQVAISFKMYNDEHITAKIRCNYGYPIANELAKKFGGGGHTYASGFKIVDGRPFNEVKSECITYASQLLDNLEQEKAHETLQHTDA